MKEKKDKRKIVLSLLIAMAFILPPTAILADGSTETADAGEFNEQTTKPKTTQGNGGIELVNINSGGGIVPLDWNNGWPVEADEIMIDSLIPEGEYDITARFCRPDYATSGGPVVVTDADTEDDTATHYDDCEVLYRNGALYGGTVSSVYGTPFKIWFQSHDGNEMRVWVNNPIDNTPRWNNPNDYLQINRDIGGDGTADWAVRYYQDTSWDFWDGSTWGHSVPYAHAYNTANQMWVNFVGSDGSVGAMFEDAQPAGNQWTSVVPCDANRDAPNEWQLAWDDDNVLNYLDGPAHLNLDLIITITSDCDDVNITFESTGETIDIINTLDCGGFDASGLASGLGSNTVTFIIPRSSLPVGDCNENGFPIAYSVKHSSRYSLTNSGAIDACVVEPAVAYDCGTAEIKKFLEIYREQETPEITDNLYCTDFEDPCDFYDEWATYDKNPDWGDNGAIDTWTWTDKKSNSPDHSFHCTAGDTYLMNQLDILEFNMDMQGLSMKNETDVLYDLVNISWAHWMEGDSIIVGGTRLIQDGGYVQVAFTSGIPPVPVDWTTISEVFYDTDGWEDEYFDNITVGGDYLFVRFVFFSDAAFCYEGWYIDDFCVDGIQDEFGEWEFVTDSHSHEQVMDGQCIEHTFIESWFAEEGTYKICVWLQTLDDCHYAVHTSDSQYCIIVEVKDCLDYEAKGLTFDPETPAWEGDDVTIFAETYNGGTLDGIDAQVQVTVQYGALETALEDGFDCAVDEVHGWGDPDDDNYFDFWFQDGRPGIGEFRNNWHFTELNQPGDCYLANFDETTMEYLDNSVRTTEWVSSPYIFTGADKDLDVTVSFDAAWALPDVPGVVQWSMAVMDDSSGYLVRFLDPYNPYIDDGPLSNGDGSWVHIEDIPVSSLIQSLIDYGHSTPTDDDLSFMIFMEKDYYSQTSDLDWSGIKLDNFEIIKLAIQEDPIIFQETKVIDYLNVSETSITEFTWEDVSVGRYLVTQQVMGDTCDFTNNTFLTSYNVINYEQDFDDGDIEFIDNTCTGPGHWQVDDCCGGSFWCGDLETTMYGEEYDDCLYIAPYDEDEKVKNRTQDYGGKVLYFDTWYQINESTDLANFSGDFGYIEFSNDSGEHWYVAGPPIQGSSSPSPDPDGEDDWISTSRCIDSGVNQIRFRFESDNDTVHNRGWMLDNIVIAGIIDDECDSMDNFEASVLCYGNWWKTPSIYYAAEGMSAREAFWSWYYWYDWYIYDPPDTTYWDVNFGAVNATLYGPEDKTYGCYDLNRPEGIVWPCWFDAPGEIECYPQNINNTFKWTYPVDGCYWGYIDGGFVADIADDDKGNFEFSADGGEVKTLFVPADWAGAVNVGIDSLYLGNELTILVTMISGDEEHGTWDGVTLQDWVFNGMKDLMAPTTTVTMSGTFDETYNYYTSKVAVSLTAADDVSGVAAIYYEVDGVQHTYDGPFTISGDGEHTLCYWSVDNEGNIETKKCVPPFRIDESGPSVTITAPGPGLFLFGNKIFEPSSGKSIHLFGGVQVAATVTWDDAPLKVVEFYMNDVKFAELVTGGPSFEVFCREKNSGSATFKVVAIDVLGQSAEASITVDTYIKIL